MFSVPHVRAVMPHVTAAGSHVKAAGPLVRAAFEVCWAGFEGGGAACIYSTDGGVRKHIATGLFGYNQWDNYASLTQCSVRYSLPYFTAMGHS